MVLSEVALEFLALTVLLAGLTFSGDQNTADILLLEFLRFGDGVVVSTLAWAKLGIALHIAAHGSVSSMFDSQFLVESVEVHRSEIHPSTLVD